MHKVLQVYKKWEVVLHPLSQLKSDQFASDNIYADWTLEIRYEVRQIYALYYKKYMLVYTSNPSTEPALWYILLILWVYKININFINISFKWRLKIMIERRLIFNSCHINR